MCRRGDRGAFAGSLGAARTDVGGANDCPSRRLGGMILAPVTVNGKFQGRLIVDTEAPLTLLTFKAAISLGIAPRLGVITSVQAPVAVAIWRPPVTLSSLRVGDVSLEDIEAVVSERLWSRPRGVSIADGVLGKNFLRHFHVTIERGVPNLLLLEARPPGGAPQ